MCNSDADRLRPARDDRRKLAIGHATFERMVSYSHPFITTIGRPLSDDEGDFVGSGAFMTFGGQTFLVTAAHVINRAEDRALSGRAVFSNGSGKPVQFISGPVFRDLELDLAVSPVTLEPPPDSTRKSCPESLIASRAGTLCDFLFVHGFPSARSRYSRIGPCIHSETLPFGTSSVEPTWPDFDPAVHFAVGFTPQYTEFSDGTNADIPLPDGMSGCPVWNTRRAEVGDSWKVNDARIVGVIHRFDQEGQCLIGTKIECLHDLITTAHRNMGAT